MDVIDISKIKLPELDVLEMQKYKSGNSSLLDSMKIIDDNDNSINEFQAKNSTQIEDREIWVEIAVIWGLLFLYFLPIYFNCIEYGFDVGRVKYNCCSIFIWVKTDFASKE